MVAVLVVGVSLVRQGREGDVPAFRCRGQSGLSGTSHCSKDSMRCNLASMSLTLADDMDLNCLWCVGGWFSLSDHQLPTGLPKGVLICLGGVFGRSSCTRSSGHWGSGPLSATASRIGWVLIHEAVVSCVPSAAAEIVGCCVSEAYWERTQWVVRAIVNERYWYSTVGVLY